jgi:hypothetical protein
MRHFIAQREKLRSFLLELRVQQRDWVTEGTVRGLTAQPSSESGAHLHYSSGLDLETKILSLRSRRSFFLDIPFYRTH